MILIEQEAELIRIIMSDRIIGTIFIKERFYSKMSREEIAEELEKGYPGFSQATYLRRSTNVRTWLNWISSKLGIE